MANQRDVARVAGVSSATVSRFLTNPSCVSPQAAASIREAVKTLHYQVDASAQALRMGKSRHVGVLSPGGGPFHWEVFSVVQAVFQEAGYFSTLYLTHADGEEAEEPLSPLLRGRQLDGVLYFPTLQGRDDRSVDQLMAWGRPFVVLDRPLLHTAVPQVYIDNYQAGRRAAREMLELGHRHFLFLWGIQDFSSSQNRFSGFRDELKRAGVALPLDRQLEGEFFSLTAYEETRRRWANLPEFTAVFASNDSSALGFLKAAREHGRDAPRDFSLVGFDDNFEFTLLYDPPLATFRQPAKDMGRLAAQMLLALLEERPPESTRIALDVEFIPRASLGQAP